MLIIIIIIMNYTMILNETGKEIGQKIIITSKITDKENKLYYLGVAKRMFWEAFIKGTKDEKHLLTVSDQHIDAVFNKFGIKIKFNKI